MKSGILLIFAFICCGVNSQNYTLDDDGWYSTPDSQIHFNVLNITNMQDDTKKNVSWQTTLEGAHHVVYDVTDDNIFFLENVMEQFYISEGSNITADGSFTISNTFLGYSNLTITIYDINNKILESKTLYGTVLIGYPVINKIFLYILGIMIFIVYVNMGATLDLTVVSRIMKKPVGPLVGLCCQYSIMPLVAFGLAMGFFSDNPLLQLGIFLNGASPGGGQSNIWAYLLGGSLDLSIAMTFTSTIVAFIAVPVWVFSLGPVIFRGTAFVIPYAKIATIVVMLVIPCGLGIAMQKVRPKWSAFLAKHILKKVAVINMIFILTFGTYANRYIFAIFTPKILCACLLLPLLGYVSGLIIAKLTRRPTEEIISISIETGVQNANIAIFILKSSLPMPAGDLTVVIPAAVFLLTPVPLIIVYCLKKIYEIFTPHEGKNVPKEVKEVKSGKENSAFDAVTEQGLQKY